MKSSSRLKIVSINTPLSLTPLMLEKSLADMSNSDLVVACQHKQQGAFECLLKRHERSIVNTLYRLAPDFIDTADFLQEVSIKVWRSIARLKNPHAFKTWLNSIVTHLFYDELRKRSYQCKVVSMDAPFANSDDSENRTRDISDTAARPDELVLRAELSSAMMAAFANVSEQFRTAVYLRDVEGKSYEEIATITQVTIGTVKSRIARARGKVRKLLVPYLEPAA